MEAMSVSPWVWLGFTAFVLSMLALDLGVFHRNAHVVSFKEALNWSLVCVGLAAAFNAGIYHWYGGEKALEFTTGYLIEMALSVDNIFVFLVLFSYFAVPPALQHRVLFWGVLGALVLRAIFIALGSALLQEFHWVIYLFGGLLVLTGIRLLLHQNSEMHPERNPLYRLFKRYVPAVPDYRGSAFVVREGGRWLATPLLLVLVLVEGTDLVFAIDSIPAIFAVTKDPFIVYTSNIFAILGLRSLFFLLAGVVEKFHHLKTGLALVLAFVGSKMMLVDLYKIPIGVSLGVVVALIGGSIALSLLRPKATEGAPVSERRAAQGS
ncbi:MAG: TerC family protein [Candidatus Handelsmanbacteria bacterium]|nr:TerC family protein [Candidatus Handelsmanbacteria bacterium]